jgi:tRNA threonylcarbamoyladenosine biosynthesis protein TsaB
MRILAIDTALAVCAAAVLDTERPGMRTRESIPMVRGHAEALMPLIAKDDSIPVMAVIDARHGQVYLQVFGVGGRSIVRPRVAPIHEALRAPPPGPLRIVGSAARLVAAARPAGEPALALVEEYPAPDIDWVARLGAAATGPAPPKPLYLRAADAQPQDASRLARR